MSKLRFDSNPLEKAYDCELAVLEALTPHPGFCWPVSAIAEACGISRQQVYHLQNRALSKLRVGLRFGNLREEFRESLRRAG